MAGSGTEKAFRMLKELPRVTLANVKPLPGTIRRQINKRRGGSVHQGRGKRGSHKFGTLPKLGYEGGQTPFWLAVPMEPYYHGHHMRRQYPVMSLLKLQRLIDIGMIDPSEPIDLTTLCNSGWLRIKVDQRHYGVNLTDEGADCFAAKVNVEVQHTEETTIAAVERNGGVITTRFYDLPCVDAMVDPARFFRKGVPIPRCKLPPKDAIEYYSDPKNRGYLADPEKVMEAREELAQKYGYKLPNLQEDPCYEMLTRKKGPRQIWYGLSAGWVVNLTEKTILKPTDPEVQDYYYDTSI